MIPANKNDIFDSILYAYFKGVTRRAFHTIAARGIEKLRALPADRPVIIFCNHTNWWDGVLIYLLTRQMRHKAGYLMMEEKQLKHYNFFTWLGRVLGRPEQPDPLGGGASVCAASAGA